MNKYHAQKTKIGDITFSSKKEANRFCELKTFEKQGIIKDLILQPRFVLQEEFTVSAYPSGRGIKIRKIEYVGDFQYKNQEGEIIVEDSKGYAKNPVYLLKKKMFLKKYPEIIFLES